jgi:uncharacterized protein (DUF3084 family)
VTTLDKPLTAEDVASASAYAFQPERVAMLERFVAQQTAQLRADLVAAIEARAQAERERDAAHTYARERCEERDLALDDRDAARAETRAAYEAVKQLREHAEAFGVRLP